MTFFNMSFSAQDPVLLYQLPARVVKIFFRGICVLDRKASGRRSARLYVGINGRVVLRVHLTTDGEADGRTH